MNKLAIVILLVGISEFPGTDSVGGPPTFTVSMEYFSGQASPTWTIKAGNENYDDISKMYMSAMKGQLLLTIDKIPAQLGYRGFLVCDESSEMLVLGKATKDLQKRILQSAPKGLLSDKIIKQVTAAIEQGVEPTKTKQRRATSYPPDGVWNDERVQNCNNCYNYGVDKTLAAHFKFGVPGLGGGQAFRVPGNFLTAENVKNGAIRDKLVETPAGAGNSIPKIPQAQAATSHLVALVVAPESAPGAYDGDFHWYRLDSNNLWSHKAGKTAVTNRDWKNAFIDDPRKKTFNSPAGPDYKFVCFMTVVKDVVTVQGTPNDEEC